MPFNFDKLQTIHCFDAVTVRVPERWQCGPDYELDEFWSCYEENEDTGTLWITVQWFQGPEVLDEAPNSASRRLAEDAMQSLNKINEAILTSEMKDIPGGHLVYRVYDADEGGDLTRHYRYHFYRFEKEKMAFADFNFVVTRSLIDVPGFRDLIQLMDREIRAAKIEPFGKV
jgi:hypothetical protein